MPTSQATKAKWALAWVTVQGLVTVRGKQLLSIVPGLKRLYLAWRWRVIEIQLWLDCAAPVSHLIANQPNRLKVKAGWLLFPLRGKLPSFAAPRTMRLDLRFGGYQLAWLVRRPTDLLVAREILVDGEYANLPVTPPGVILDLGSHVGFSLLYFKATYPSARIIGVEPDPQTFRCLESNVAALEGVEAYELAIAGSNGSTDFYPGSEPWGSSLRDQLGTRPVTVESRTLDALLDDLELPSVDVLKIDIEGGERSALGGCARLSDIRSIVGELHDFGSQPYRDEFFSLLAGFDVQVSGGTGKHTTFVAVRRG